MKLIKPQYFKNKSIISFLLVPFTLVIQFINFLKNLQNKKKFKIKTICVGNVYVGGTGKTSLSIEINNILNKKFKTVFKKNILTSSMKLNYSK